MERKEKLWLALGGIAVGYGFFRGLQAFERHVRREMVVSIFPAAVG